MRKYTYISAETEKYRIGLTDTVIINMLGLLKSDLGDVQTRFAIFAAMRDALTCAWLDGRLFELRQAQRGNYNVKK